MSASQWPGRVRREGRRAVRIRGDETRAHLVADLERRGPIAGPSHARTSRGGSPKPARVCSSTPASRPRQPAWAAATRVPAALQNRTGRQSAVITTQTLPG
jgi:hypothetical protein